ncbi:MULTISPECIES: DUF2971 domain-containing protein [Yersinia]|uniref:Protein of uncharacterized function (DUF2971) n=1 Tax=Yersinia frederiksenii TaxID=29484 RepID=A0AAI9EN19_YERFR|nr:MULTISPECIES: DUF2971 domain-containing protein [Yersinia]MDN0126876.1 DUF2971 domain-containing protein [Yersinia massiliensis]CFQ87887.1 Protein of uncharacterised function (DUF2971) [Yersinia frederiksenii]
MSYNNYINLASDLMDKPIYRIMPIHRFLQMLEEKKLTLVKPKKWDDPFENALLNCVVETSDGETGSFSAKDCVYGQCWTFHRETDAMWRIYSHDKDGVRVSTTPRKLLTALRKAEPKHHNLKCFIGKVSYLPKKALLKKLQSINLLNDNGSGIAESLLYKRTEFKHENEIRLIYSGDDDACISDIFKFDIDPAELLDRVLFDPRMEKNLRQAYVLAIEGKGCKTEVKRSTLYDAPPGLIFKLP